MNDDGDYDDGNDDGDAMAMTRMNGDGDDDE